MKSAAQSLRLIGVVAVVFLVSASLVRPARADLFITELMAVNDSALADEDGDFSDWLEIHNSGSAAVDLGGSYLTDDAGRPTKWQFPATSIGPGGYVIVFASGKDRAMSAAELHANFKLASAGEYLGLIASDGLTVLHEYRPGFPAGQRANISYGLARDLTTERCFVVPTPGTANDESPACGPVEPVEFSVERGFFESPFQVALSTTTAGAVIYYTTDGSDPSAANGSIYAASIDIATTTTLRAVAVLDAVASSVSVTKSYLFLEDVLVQDATGLPTTWTADYEMDPRIVGDPNYGASIRDDLLSIPTLSIAMDMNDLFGETDGIYSHPQKSGLDWERPASAELIHADGSPGFQVNCGIRIQGRVSRTKNRKKSFRLAFKSIYGPAKLEYPLFPESPVRRFDKLRLRASHGKSWSFGVLRSTYIRDQWVRDSQIAMGGVASHGMFAHVYLNGLYWGLYNVVEQPDEGFAQEHFGGDEDDWDVRAAGADPIVHGDDAAWHAAQAIMAAEVATAVGYSELRRYVDVDNLIDYMLVNIHAGTLDWDRNNWFAARLREPGAGFKFFSWDAEQSMEKVTSKRIGVSNPGQPSAFYSRLRGNAEFRVLFGDHVHRHFFEDGALSRERSVDRFMARADEIARALVAESARWGDARRQTDPLTRDEHWLKEVEWMRLAYLPQRSARVLEQLREAGLYPQLSAPVFGQHGGAVPAGVELLITSPGPVASTVYYTLDGTDPRREGGAVAGTVYDGPIALTSEVTVKARALASGQWSALTEAHFLIDVPLRISELMFHPAAPAADPIGASAAGLFDENDFEFVELTNVGAGAVDLTGLRFTRGIDFTFAASSIAPAAHVLVVADTAAFESRYGAGLPVVGQYDGRFDNDGDRVRLERADGSGMVDFRYGDRWYPQADGGGRSLTIVDVAGPVSAYSSRESWRPSPLIDGSPGRPELPMCSDTVDNDGDGLIDHPADPGCETASQDTENPACDDGDDNDEDGLVDTADPQCAERYGETEAFPGLDRFTCYSARSAALAGPFRPVMVSLDDAFDPPGAYLARAASGICLPSSIDGAAIVDPAIHLTAYNIGEAAGTPVHQKQTRTFVDALGPIFLETSRPQRLLVPAALDADSAVPAPVAGSHSVDHYKCYKVKRSPATPKYFPRGVQVRAAEAFEDRLYDLKKPTELCVAADMNGAGVNNPDGGLVCYAARRARDAPKHRVRLGVHVNDALGPLRLDTRKVSEICVPLSTRRGRRFPR